MKTWVDVSAASATNKSGVEGYIYQLSHWLPKLGASEVTTISGLTKVESSISMPIRSQKWYLESIGALSCVFAKNIHLPFSIMPKHCAPAVITIYDLAYKRFPEVYSASQLSTLEIKVGHAIRQSRHIIAISESTKRDLIHFYGLDDKKISVTLLAADATFQIDPLINKHDGRYILAVGNLQPRKNLVSLLQAFSAISKDFSHNLYIVGQIQSGSEGSKLKALIAKLNLNDRVKFTGYINTNELKKMYAEATVFVYPSVYEGFGLPILESMMAGTPVIIGANSSLPEVAGDAAFYTKGTDMESIKDVLVKVLSNEVLRSNFRKKGFEQAEKFSWEDTARATLEVYRSLD